MAYCVVPPNMAGRARRSIERAVRDEADVEILVERRSRDRRGGPERRRGPVGYVPALERRRVGYPDGRRVAERRAVLVPVEAPSGLGRTVGRHDAELSFLEPLDVPEDFRADIEAVRAIVRFKSGESDFAELYDRWFDPVWIYLSVTLDRGVDVELQVSITLADAFRELAGAVPSPTQVRAWLFGLAYRTARPRGLELPRPLTADGGPLPELDDPGEPGLSWLTDDDLLLLIERRPPAERHVLVLRYFAGLAFVEIASIMGIEASGAVALHRAAVASLDATLAGVGRSPRMEERHPMGRLIHQTPALRQRRRALLAA